MAKENHNSQDDMNQDQDADCVLNGSALSDVSDLPLELYIIDEDHDTVEIQAGGGTHEWVFLHHDDSYIGAMQEIQNSDSTEQSVSGESEQSQDPELHLFISDSFDHQSDESTDSCPPELLDHDVTEDTDSSSMYLTRSELGSWGEDDRHVAVPSRTRRRTTEGQDVKESVDEFRIEQTENFALFNSRLQVAFQDEFTNFACAVADSLRKLPANGLRAAKRKLFEVLDEAHGL